MKFQRSWQWRTNTAITSMSGIPTLPLAGKNVPGAFSSNKGEDFRAVLEAVCSVKGRDIPLPEPPKGRWANAGSIMADGFSLAWRVLDAQ